jgi:hypothetical protein
MDFTHAPELKPKPLDLMDFGASESVATHE